MSDFELLQQYVRENSQTAFTALVNRHLNLVYSAARRQVASAQLAEEVAQSVFLDLSRRAPKISPTQPLAAWLYVVTRRSAIDVVRRESRRLVRETTAAELAAMKTPSSNWNRVELLLDEAMEKLSETERSALVLRFFENQSLREVGETLGISQDTAQKRISRALERLRGVFAARGVAVGSAALAADLSAHAASAAPAGLATAIASSTAALPAATLAAAKQLAMTTAQKIFATAALTAAFGFALYEGLPAWQLHGQVGDGQQELDRLAESARQLRLEQIAASRQLASLERNRAATPEPGSDAALGAEAAAWLARVGQLKQALVLHPELGIPELQLLTEDKWFLAAINQDFSQKEIARSLRYLRTAAKQKFIERVSDAAKNYFGDTHRWPAQFDELAPLLTPPVDPAILARYDLQNEGDRMIIAEKLAGATDPDWLALGAWEDTKTKRGLSGFNGAETVQDRAVREAAQAYSKAHGGERARDPAQLWPFLSQPLDAAALAKSFYRLPLSRSSAPSTP